MVTFSGRIVGLFQWYSLHSLVPASNGINARQQHTNSHVAATNGQNGHSGYGHNGTIVLVERVC